VALSNFSSALVDGIDRLAYCFVLSITIHNVIFIIALFPSRLLGWWPVSWERGARGERAQSRPAPCSSIRSGVFSGDGIVAAGRKEVFSGVTEACAVAAKAYCLCTSHTRGARASSPGGSSVSARVATMWGPTSIKVRSLNFLVYKLLFPDPDYQSRNISNHPGSYLWRMIAGWTPIYSILHLWKSCQDQWSVNLDKNCTWLWDNMVGEWSGSGLGLDPQKCSIFSILKI
jgi:hypothetical protein